MDNYNLGLGGSADNGKEDSRRGQTVNPKHHRSGSLGLSICYDGVPKGIVDDIALLMGAKDGFFFFFLDWITCFDGVSIWKTKA